MILGGLLAALLVPGGQTVPDDNAAALAIAAESRAALRMRAADAAAATGIPRMIAEAPEKGEAPPRTLYMPILGELYPASALRAEQQGRVLQFTIALNKLPAAYKEPTLVRVRFQDDAVVDCSIEATSGSDALDRIACQQARRGVTRPASFAGLFPQPDTCMVNVVFAVGEGAAQ